MTGYISPASRSRPMRTFALAGVAAACLSPIPAAAQDQGAQAILHSMSDYLAAQDELSSRFDVALEIVTPSIEKIQFTASGNLLLDRPDKLRLRRTGGYNDIELVFDGKTATIVDIAGNHYASMGLPGSIDALVAQLRDQYFVEMPAADLLLTDSYAALMQDTLEAKNVGIGVVNGHDCHHLAFRGFDTDWQIWIRTGDKPLPCKLVIASKTVAAAPTYTIQFGDWSSTPRTNANAFAFQAASGAQAVQFSQLAGLGELPPPAPLDDGDAR